MSRTNLWKTLYSSAPPSQPLRSASLRMAVPAAVLAGAATACGGGSPQSAATKTYHPAAPPTAATSPPSTAGGEAETIMTAPVGNLGQVLVDGEGHTVYLFEKDHGGNSSCTGACAAVWPPVTTTAQPHASSMAKASMLATFKRSDGKTQVSYGGHPLYYYAPDGGMKGSDKGQGLNQFGALWYVVSPTGMKVQQGGY